MTAIDPERFAALAEDIRVVASIHSDRTARLDHARKAAEESARALAVAKDALVQYVTDAAGSRLWP